jgi:hypothetical protein
MRIVTIGAIIAALATTAYAQPRGVSPNMNNPNVKTEAEKALEEKQRKEDEKAYKDSVSRIPDRDLKLDPWAKIR